ncbi:MAG: DUF4383 domain-containing protein [Streptosporangiales bacterium]|nr:DUF4383 domain-containing protein [Streptosporangiales bacterium]
MTSSAGVATQSANRWVGYVLGAVYLLVGAVGFAITIGVGFAAAEGRQLIIFELNPLHNIVHLLVGALLLGAALRGTTSAKAVNTLVGGVYLLVGVAGLFVIGSALNLLALNSWDNVLHLASAVLLVGVGVAADRSVRTRAQV